MEWGPRPEPEPPPWTDAHPDPPYGFEVRPGVRTLGGAVLSRLGHCILCFRYIIWSGQGVTWVYVIVFSYWGL